MWKAESLVVLAVLVVQMRLLVLGSTEQYVGLGKE